MNRSDMCARKSQKHRKIRFSYCFQSEKWHSHVCPSPIIKKSCGAEWRRNTSIKVWTLINKTVTSKRTLWSCAFTFKASRAWNENYLAALSEVKKTHLYKQSESLTLYLFPLTAVVQWLPVHCIQPKTFPRKRLCFPDIFVFQNQPQLS